MAIHGLINRGDPNYWMILQVGPQKSYNWPKYNPSSPKRIRPVIGVLIIPFVTIVGAHPVNHHPLLPNGQQETVDVAIRANGAHLVIFRWWGMGYALVINGVK